MKILVTGTAGFIGYHLTRRLVDRGDDIVGLDNINDYYDVRLKHGRLDQLGLPVPDIASQSLVQSRHYENLRFVRADLSDSAAIIELFAAERFDRVCHLAAQAGVRHSITNPSVYVSSNIQGFLNILEAARSTPVDHLVYASSSSVYGVDKLLPFRESSAADHPTNLYAVSKRSNELTAHSYSHLFNIPTTGLRFFSAYGAWGRPDMALFMFTNAILEGRAIDVFNYGEMSRDFTYIDDIVEGIVRVVDRAPKDITNGDAREGGAGSALHRIYNMGNGAPVQLMDFIRALEKELGVTAKKNMLPIQPGDVPATCADCSKLERDVGYKPSTDIATGIREFVKWYRTFYSA